MMKIVEGHQKKIIYSLWVSLLVLVLISASACSSSNAEDAATAGALGKNPED
jgi:hypothetical protein